MEGQVAKSANEKFCKDCGSVINVNAEICPQCGVRQQQIADPFQQGKTPNGKSRITAALLAFFLGGLGIHKFYLGQIGWGIVYLLFCWTLIPGVVAFIEFILLLVMDDDTFNRRFGMS